MSLFLNINFLANSFPKALKLWEIADFSNGLIQYEGLQKLVNINTCRTIKVENYTKNQAKDTTKASRFSISHTESGLQGTHSISYIHLSDWGIDQLLVKGFDKLIRARENWWGPVLEHPNFVMARLINQDYSHKQNSDSLCTYDIYNWSHEHLPKISNGYPPPLEESIVDTRVNPGHWRFKSGYIEAVSAEMWLSKHFFEAVNLDRAALNDLTWLEVNEEHGVVHIKAWSGLFDSDVGDQREIQIILRKLLFGQSEYTEDPNFTLMSEFDPAP
ncbi:hypothetical protein L1286_14810 [Pseudoalteromonas sp. SMS1]|uniref:hypothetical protein n=1 Tax=Pseudoalteromonas sp. SMS1 TaxID=2908894 RepID=UPI001F388FDB|nr:hypothetical protein [Pseudoalteromonas sp. SMS1]MCF2858754.1 hypothetical protein [Pseudoalteromonas sp. SMS1]